MREDADIAIVGGGLIGLWTAVRAARAGRRVHLLEAETIGRHASCASAGGIRSLNRHPAEIPLARAALALWRTAAADLGSDVGFVPSGQVRVAEDDEAMTALEARAAATRALGYDHEVTIGAAALAALEPALARHCRGALVVRDDGFADPLKTVHALARAARAAGVRVSEQRPALAVVRDAACLRVETPTGPVRAPIVVNAAGAWGDAPAAGAGEPVPLTPTALQMSVTEPLAPFVSAVVGTQNGKLSLKQKRSGHVVIGGGFAGEVDAAHRIGRPRPTLVGANLANAQRLFPHLAEARIVRTWAGLEGVTADGLPIISASRTTTGLIHAFGFSAHGFALSPLIAHLILEIADGRPSSAPIAPFGVDRFPSVLEERRYA
ncbi:FAD-binding oxidoreductase [Acuticoccus sp. I52.16.1]|uniref:NAD(P)/FAD-dependent oxidoreductase n=1 Tax=Acuticoccus sp. I52.16.1 TaxID=2928472 RepID=UPI001FD477B7|nr:FAD-binding oxidoreductase [Acuticoccus sp. I52.16.1]UOM34079.1 FAD-binding oxidoreductase [Acuticoccus sp. I52.16.1]